MLHKPIKKAWLLYVCLLTMLTGCYKCIKDMQPKTLNSEDFACMLNGKLWLPSGNLSFPNSSSNPGLGYDETFNGGSFSASADIYTEINGENKLVESMGFSGDGVGAIGEYNLKNSNLKFYYTEYNGMGTGDYVSDTEIPSSCKLTITTLDKVNRVIAGTFSFTLEKRDTGKKVVITEGRFNMKYL